MESVSPVFAALGVVEFDILNDLCHWLDGPVQPMAAAEQAARLGLGTDGSIRAGQPAVLEG